MTAAPPPAEALDFHRYHREELPALLAAGRGAPAASGARALGSLAFRLPEGDAYPYVPTAADIDVVAGDAAADTVIELEAELWRNLVGELDAAAGLRYGGRARCRRGSALRWVAWEPALRAMWTGRPVYRADELDLRGRRGAPLDPEQTFTLASDREDMAHFLRTAGYLFVRGVFAADEIAALRTETEALAREARKGDKLSWWGKNAAGEEVLPRVTRAAAKPGLRALPRDPRLLALAGLADEKLDPRVPLSAEEGVSVIWKRPNMSEGLGDPPWHRDCDMGGHAVMCPVLIASVFLTPATPETGELRMLPGSWQRGCGPIDARHPQAPRGASFAAAPGDVSLHHGDTMHAAPPPGAQRPRQLPRQRRHRLRAQRRAPAPRPPRQRGAAPPRGLADRTPRDDRGQELGGPITIEIADADLSSQTGRACVVALLDAYARDPMAGGAPLPADVRARLGEALRERTARGAAVVLLAREGGKAAGVADRARALGCCKVTLAVREDNAPARRLYARAGFVDSAPAGAATRALFLERGV
jgi:hypothetical protein